MRSELQPRLCRLVPVVALVFATVMMNASVSAAQMPSGVLRSLEGLTGQPASHMGYTFDRSQLQDAVSVLESGGLDPGHAAAALSSVSLDTYRYKDPAFYTPEAMGAIVEAYHHAGWKHLVDQKATAANSAQPRSTLIDLWLHFTGANIDHVTVLMRGERDMNLIQVAGDLRPLDLLHLAGHFGIPKVDPDAVMVPAPDGR
ncbi:MAG: hypothetical protein NVSMB62_04050 [Acidobacteriaceae bacterium]